MASFWSKLTDRKTLLVAGIGVAVLAIGLTVLVFSWIVDIPPNHVGVLTKKTGEALPEGEVVARDDSFAGVQMEVLTTGWHVINPFVNDVEIVPATVIASGQFGLVKRKTGKKPGNPNDILVEEGERGYQRQLLEPGTHFLNPEVFDVEVVDPIEIPALHVGVVTSHTGKTSSKSLVDRTEQGLWKDILGPGTYPMNPKGYTVEIVKAIEVEAGHVGVVRSRFGRKVHTDLVAEGEQGIWRKVLHPGTYNWNTKAYSIEMYAAVRIEAGFVGVVVAQTDGAVLPPGIKVIKVAEGAEPKAEPGGQWVVAAGTRGIQPYTLPPGLHYLNPYEFKVITVDARRQKYEMTLSDHQLAEGEVSGDDRLTFPSSDGFEIKVDTSIEWQVMPAYIPHVVADIGNIQQIVQKIIRPNAREIGRLEGSKLEAKDFILGTKRELFVKSFSDTLQERCKEKKIEIHKALVRAVFPPEKVAGPLKEKEVSRLRNEANVQKQVEARSKAALAEEEAKIEQKKEVIKADTRKLVAERNAELEKEVARIKAEQRKEVAKVQQEQQSLILERQKLEALGIRELADAEAHKARSLVVADGALSKKLKAWTDVMGMWAGNPNLVPRLVIGGGAGGKGGITGQELIMTLMSLERLDKFLNTKLANTSTDPLPGDKP